MKYLVALIALYFFVGTFLHRSSFARTAPEQKGRHRGKRTLARSVVALYYCGSSFFNYFGSNFLTHSQLLIEYLTNLAFE